MRERTIFLYVVQVAAAVLCFAHGGATARFDEGQGAVAILAVIVLLSAALLLGLMHLPGILVGAVFFCACALTVWRVGGFALPVVAMAAVSIGVLYLRLPQLAAASVVVCAVFAAASGAFAAGLGFSIIVCALLLGFSLYVLALLGRWEGSERAIEQKANQAEDLRELLDGQRYMAKRTERVSRLEERNRLAARIHDEIGHGMSGSILLLEGAQLVMDKEPEKARETIRKVTKNLRDSVDEIRKVLREERSDGPAVSLARIESELAAFGADHPHIRTRLDIGGDVSRIKAAVWACVCENMTEALTNVLKHAPDAEHFWVSVKNSEGLLRVEFADDGGGRGAGHLQNEGTAPGGGMGTRHGIGLQNMEERAALCYGRCFFRRGPDGFHIVMTFPGREG
ncbi:MAG: histidine kinase [Clostridiales Family XIII bacterium]|jgi:signal transduction histidine kinase|nr:histidine kinase [Clostridiales Family XIII bacterium]